MSERTATFIRQLTGFRGDARLYRVEPPISDIDGNDHGHVVVSATIAPYGGPETYIFPATESGEIADWGELDGSLQGALDHHRALAGAGYVVREAA